MKHALPLLGLLLTLSTSFAQGINYRGNFTLTSRTAIDAVGPLVYSAGLNNFAIVDATNPSAPVLRGQVQPNVASITGIEVQGNYAYCAGQVNGLVVIEVTNPNAPVWRVNRQLAAAARDVAVHDTLVGVATATNVTLLGVSNPLNPRILTTFPRTASWIEFDAVNMRLHVGSTTGAYALQVTNSGGTVSMSLYDQFDTQALTPVAYAAPYVNAVRNAIVRVINATSYDLAGQYTSTADINAIVSGFRFSFVGLATGVVQYVNQTNPNPQFVDAATVPGPSSVTGLALGNSGSTLLVYASHGTGVAVLEYDALTDAPDAPALLPDDLSLAAYPNPFNGVAKLTLAVPQSGEYELKVFDSLGRAVSARRLFLAGTTSQELDFSGHAAGAYTVQLAGAAGAAALRLIYLP